jgi:hypothetical protein
MPFRVAAEACHRLGGEWLASPVRTGQHLVEGCDGAVCVLFEDDDEVAHTPD